MKFIIVFFAALFILPIYIDADTPTVFGDDKYPLTITDNDGNTITLPTKPQRIASLTLGTDENLWEIVDHSRIVVMTAISRSDYVSNVDGNIIHDKVMIKDQSEWEKVLNAKPDLILAATYTRKIADPLVAKGLPVYLFSNFRGIDALKENIKILGTLTGEEEKASELINKMHQTIQASSNKKWSKKIKAIYYSEGRLSGRSTTPSDVIKAAGLVDACGESGIVGTVKATPTLIANLNPDIILVGEDCKLAEDETLKLFQSTDYQDITAVKAGNIYTIPGKHITTVSHRIVKAILDVQDHARKYANKL